MCFVRLTLDRIYCHPLTFLEFDRKVSQAMSSDMFEVSEDDRMSVGDVGEPDPPDPGPGPMGDATGDGLSLTPPPPPQPPTLSNAIVLGN